MVLLQGSEAARGPRGYSSGICLRLSVLVVFTGSAGATCMVLLQGSEAARGSCGYSSGICLRLDLLVCFHRKQTTGLKCKAFGFEG